jgi:coproporphyrinogen III oxidase-like Fe-S oxidoreductase
MDKINVHNFWGDYLRTGDIARQNRAVVRNFSEVESIWKACLDNRCANDYLTLYVHFPYCVTKCSYCMHSCRAIGEKSETCILDFIKTIEDQFKIASQIFKAEPIKAIYIGGGAPSLLSARDIKMLFCMIQKYWNVKYSPDNECSIELHVSHITDDKLSAIELLPINRISIGIQSLNEEVLRASNREYTSRKRIFECIQIIMKNAGETRLNIDLMYGLPKQTDEIFLSDVNELAKANVSSITMYGYRNTSTNGNNRPLSNDQHFMRKLIDVMDKVKRTDKYTFNGSSERLYNEWNILTHKSSRGFMHEYSPVPEGFNNILSFGPYWGHKSLFQPINKWVEFNKRGVFVQNVQPG